MFLYGATMSRLNSDNLRKANKRLGFATVNYTPKYGY
jgi:hypothetical protein